MSARLPRLARPRLARTGLARTGLARTVVALAIAATVVGCGRLTSYRYPLSQPAAPAAQRPGIYFEGNLPGEAMQELAMVEAVGSGTKASAEDVLGAMQDDAARLGANAIVRVKVDCAYGTCHGYGVAVRFLGR